ncbi:MAG: hypothetical protein GF364_18035 [Candidatus Lokiarchaeota archaeon]|nr:hypothetical protein [Candidatus Lokiarchaeota archaeon]
MATREICMKLGSCIINNLSKNNSFLTELVTLSQQLKLRFFLIPGGGNIVQGLRNIYKCDPNKDSKNDEYHWRAIELMDQNAEKLYQILNKIKYQSKQNIPIQLKSDYTFNNLDKFGIFILKCEPLLREKDDLKHSWGVTSDSISIYLGNLLRIENIFLVKDIDYIESQGRKIRKISASNLSALMKETGYSTSIESHLGKGTKFPLDPFAPMLIKEYHTNVLIINSTDLRRFKMLLNLVSQQKEKKEKIDFDKFGTLIY